MKLHFSITGDFITQTAREKLKQHDLLAAMKLLMDCTMCDELSESEHIRLCVDILTGRKSLTGTYPDGDYQVVDNAPEEHAANLMSLVELTQEQLDTLKKLETETASLKTKLDFVLAGISTADANEINSRYYEQYDEYLFPPRNGHETIADRMLESFLAVQKYPDKLKDSSYGWLEPDGTFHPVPWGEHQSWANGYLDSHYPENLHPELYGTFCSGDILTNKLGFILLHSPSQGIAQYTMSSHHRMTKAQKEFLYDYYTKRGHNSLASDLYRNDL